MLRLPEIPWSYGRNVPSIPPVCDDGLCMVKDGLVECLEPRSGKRSRRGRPADGSPEGCASPVAAEGKIYIGTPDGRPQVLEAGAARSVLSLNELGAEIWASPAIVERQVCARTESERYSFASTAPGAEEQEAAGL